jgi:asparagine N-glycosylation enzyme membrane subunit Stt3
MVDASRPIGGILFGLAFILVARKLQNQEIKDYLILTGIGFLLLLISYEGQVLITAPFPPLGLLSGSFFGLASYLIFIGLYSSAVSISQDSKLRVLLFVSQLHQKLGS